MKCYGQEEKQSRSTDEDDDRTDLVARVAQLESQIEDVTTTLRDEKENRRLVQHELESSNSMCQKLEHALQSQKTAPSASQERLPSQDERGMQTDSTGRESEEDVSRQKLVKKMRNYSAASLLVEEYKSNQQTLEVQVKKLSQECAAKDEELSRVGQKCAEFIQRNVQLEAEVESMRDDLSRKERLIHQQGSHLKESESSLEEKTEMMKKLKMQRDTLSGKYHRAKRQASKLKGVVVSFNKTVAEFRREREQMAHRAVSTRGTTVKDQSKMVDSPSSHQDHQDAGEDGPPEESDDQATPPSIPRAHTDVHSEGTSPQASQGDGGWYRGPDEGLGGHPLCWSSDDSESSEDSCTEIPSGMRPEWGISHPSQEGQRKEQQRGGGMRGNHTQHHGDVQWGSHFPTRDHAGYDPRGNEPQRAARGLRRQPQGATAARTATPFGDMSVDREGSFGPASDLSSSFSQDDSGAEESGDEYRHDDGGLLDQRSKVKGTWGALSNENLPSSHESAEGLFLVKHEMESYATRAVDRSWNFVYIRHVDNRVWFHENRDYATLGLTLDGMEPLDLSGAIVCPLRDYAKRSHVFCIQMSSGARYLLQARDEMDMLYWICRLSSGTGDTSLGPDCFSQGKAPARSSPTATDRLKNFVRGGLSAIWK